jgi:uncharacterized membrane protein
MARVALTTRQIWGFSIALLSFILGIAYLTNWFQITAGFINGLVLIVLAITLLSESIAEEKIRSLAGIGRFEALEIFLGVVALIFGVMFIFSVTIPANLMPVAGFLMVINGLLVAVELWK